MKQKEIWLADLNPVRGSDQEGFRPVVIVSGNMLNNYLPIVIACPLTSNIKKMKGNIVLNPNQTNGLNCDSEVLIFHIRSISKERLVKLIGSISDSEFVELKNGLDDILRY